MQIDPRNERGSVSVLGRMTPESTIDVMLAALTAARARQLRTVLFDECRAVGGHIATTVANRGLEAAIFGSAADALAWLDAV